MLQSTLWVLNGHRGYRLKDFPKYLNTSVVLHTGAAPLVHALGGRLVLTEGAEVPWRWREAAESRNDFEVVGGAAHRCCAAGKRSRGEVGFD
jgi:hypothetical protein